MLVLVLVPAVIGRVEVNVFPFDRAPESFDKGIAGGAPSSIAADAAASSQQGLLVGPAGNWLPWSELKMGGAEARA